MTIQKSQGLTIQKTIVDLGPVEKVVSLAYVALSRVKNISNLMVDQPLLKGCKLLKSQ